MCSNFWTFTRVNVNRVPNIQANLCPKLFTVFGLVIKCEKFKLWCNISTTLIMISSVVNLDYVDLMRWRHAMSFWRANKEEHCTPDEDFTSAGSSLTAYARFPPVHILAVCICWFKLQCLHKRAHFLFCDVHMHKVFWQLHCCKMWLNF